MQWECTSTSRQPWTLRSELEILQSNVRGEISFEHLIMPDHDSRDC